MGWRSFLVKHALFGKNKRSSQDTSTPSTHSMGTCVSKRPLPPQNHVQDSSDSITQTPTTPSKGQSESKKAGKIKGLTKGESISFGFRKKSSNTGAIKKYSNTNTDAKTTNNNDIGDDNGNTGSLDSSGNVRAKPPKKDATRSNRFGIRQTNTVRPASVGLTPKHADFDGSIANHENHHENIVNNNNNTNASNGGGGGGSGGSMVKRRSKSASASTQRNSVTFSDTVMVQPVKKTPSRKTPSSSSGYYHDADQGCRVINSGLHTNNIIYPSPTVAGSNGTGKYTLHTTSLPKPQQPVPVNVQSRSPINTKGLKHAMNMSRREFFGMHESSDSGFNTDNSNQSYDARFRGRNLEMIMNGRHKFEVRDLERLTSEPVVNLALPKLPSVFQANNYQPAPLGGLVRPIGGVNNSTNGGRESSVTSLDITESTEEEKLMRDNNSSEKSLKAISQSSQGSKNSSPGSSRHSWCNAGEAMALKECSSISYSSDESANKRMEITEDEEDISSVTIATGNLITETSLSGGIQIRDNRELEEEANLNGEFKFAETAANLEDSNLLDDETSPTDSLVSSSSDSDEKKRDVTPQPPKLMMEMKEEKDLDDISPELEALSPLSPGTPTHASNSLSLSDVGRDFLIDDEIADQPELIFDDETKHEPAPLSSTDTPTLRDASSLKSVHATPPRRTTMRAFESPGLSRKSRNLSRTGSFDTLSPCESIASDDMMVDFDLHSSVDSIERRHQSGSDTNTSTRNSVDEIQLLNCLEKRGGEVFKDWSTLMLRTQKNNSRESITSQLPSSRPRLLARRSQASSQNGSDSPRSVESLSRRAKPLLQTTDDNMELIDKSLKNSILQDVVYFKKQLLRLRRVLQESDTLNPFDTNGASLNFCTLDENRKIDELSAKSGQPTLSEDQRQELADLRRQVVFLQSQIDDRDRTIRMQHNLITKYETAKEESYNFSELSTPNEQNVTSIETVNTATQTERLTRPLSMGTMGSDHGLASRSELPVLTKITSTTSRSTQSSPLHHQSNGNAHAAMTMMTTTPQPHQQQLHYAPPATIRKQTQISSVYTQLSSIKPTGLPRNTNACKTVRTTHIGNIQTPRTILNGNGSRSIANHKSSPELRTGRNTFTTPANNLATTTTTTTIPASVNPSSKLTNGHH